MNTRSRAASAERTPQALAARVRVAAAESQVSEPGSPRRRGIGSQLHRFAPVRASNPRTVPRSRSTPRLSPIDDPTITTPLTTAGGDVTPYSPFATGPTSSVRSIVPPAAKSWQGFPVTASSAMRRASIVGRKIRRAHAAFGWAEGSDHADTPREAKASLYLTVRSIFES